MSAQIDTMRVPSDFAVDLTLPPEVEQFNDGLLYLAIKRFLDIALTLLLLPAALLLTAAVAAAIKLASPGPVFFRQFRAGKDGRPFLFLKFRSMVIRSDDARDGLEHLNVTKGPTFKVPDDPRVTRFGRFLRRSSLDELPQLFHVLSGRMSLVGPRPLPLAEVRTDTIPERMRLRVKPGLTGLWQVSGRSEIPYAEWIELDSRYAIHRSTLLDLQILLQTVPAVLSARGAF